jgi:uncharacterized protein (DUF1684 family)
MKTRKTCIGIVATVTLFAVGCATTTPAPDDWKAWQARRFQSVAGTNGWTTLIGLHWLKEGDNSTGRHATNHIVLGSDRAPASVGVFNRKGRAVSFTAAPDADVWVDGRNVTALELETDATTNTPTRLQIGLVSIIVIQRGERTGLRVRDEESAARRDFKGLRWFPYDPAWRIEGKFVPYPVAKILRVPNVIGDTEEFVSPGEIVFTVRGEEHRLAAADEPGEEDFFILFRDRTAGDSTYGAGRFLYVARQAADGRVVIDFNRAYTPPCGFTAFATCPLPPRQNWLPFAVNAGELKPSGNHH